MPITFADREHGASKMTGRIVFEALLRVTTWGAARLALRVSRRWRLGGPNTTYVDVKSPAD
ncbi:hypothetical protein [Glaciihabitans sp. UYNi722]|uniref:hypothetical protein n=1 Tax=Glaciihabitans sp. UYNi722 TaxID=3156344 RepID=UPI003394531A